MATSRSLVALGLLTLGLVAAPGLAAAEVSLYAGAGPRFSSAPTTAAGSIRGAFGLGNLLSASLQVDGYLSGAGGAESGMQFAGGQLGLIAEVPLPLPITPEVGVGLGLVKLSPERHGVDDSVATLNGEVALRGSLGPVRIRASYTHSLWSADLARSAQAMTSQLMFQAGFGF